MANYNSGYKYNKHNLYNFRIQHVSVGGNVTCSDAMIRNVSYLRQLLSNISIGGIISRVTHSFVGKGITGTVSLIGRKISKAAYSGIAIISAITNRTFFRRVGYLFHYNMGIRYNTPAERNGNVSIKSHVSTTSRFFRNITALVGSSGMFKRVVSLKRSTGNSQITVTARINKSIKKYVHGLINAIGSLARQSNKFLSSAINLSGLIDKRSQFFRTIVADITITRYVLKVLGKNLYASVSTSSSLAKLGTFYRSISAAVQTSGSLAKKISIAITDFISTTGSAIKAFGVNLAANISIASSSRLSTIKNIYSTIYSYGYVSRVATFYRVFTDSVSVSALLDKATVYIRAIGNAVIKSFGTATKTISKYFFGAVIISRNIMNKVGDGVVSITSSLKRLKYYFFVTLDNILMPLGVKVTRDSRVNLAPTTRDNTVEIPGRHGEIDLGTEFGKRLIELHVVTDEMTAEEREHTKLRIAKHVGGETPKSLVFEEDLSKTYDVKYAGKIDLNQYPNWMDITLPFKTVEPIITGSFEKVHSGSGVVVNEGTFETPIRIEVKGPTSDPVITIGKEQLAYTGSIPNNTALVIDTASMTAKINGKNVLENISGDISIKLQPGKTSVTAPSNAYIKWKDRWL